MWGWPAEALFCAFICLYNHFRFDQQASKGHILLCTMHGNPTVSQPDVGSALEKLIDIYKLGYETPREDGGAP